MKNHVSARHGIRVMNDRFFSPTDLFTLTKHEPNMTSSRAGLSFLY